MTKLQVVGRSPRVDFERGVVRGLLVLLVALCVWVLRADADVFKLGCVASYDSTLAVPVIYGGNYPYPDSIAIFKFTVDYDATVARFRGIEQMGNGWTQVVVNDNLHQPPCNTAPPLRRLTVMIEGSWDCIAYTFADPMCWIRFGRVAHGSTVLDVPPGDCAGGMRYTEAATCYAAGNRTRDVAYLGGGCVVFGDVSDVTEIEARAWSVVKRLYR